MTNSITRAEIERIMALAEESDAAWKTDDHGGALVARDRMLNALGSGRVVALCAAALRGIEPEGEPVAWMNDKGHVVSDRSKRRAERYRAGFGQLSEAIDTYTKPLYARSQR